MGALLQEAPQWGSGKPAATSQPPALRFLCIISSASAQDPTSGLLLENTLKPRVCFCSFIAYRETEASRAGLAQSHAGDRTRALAFTQAESSLPTPGSALEHTRDPWIQPLAEPGNTGVFGFGFEAALP